MKNFCLPSLYLCVIALVISACTLEKEPEIPAGADNFDHPVFSHMVEVAPDNNDNFQAMAWLDSPGNLNILHHGWVWDEAPMPTIEDHSLDSGMLKANSFSNTITGLELGKVYYLRPYVSTGDTTIYGDELCSFLGVNISSVTGNDIFKGMQVEFSNTTLANCTYLWEFGDDSTSTEVSPKHIYNNDPGTVSVTLTADIGGCKVTKEMTLHILPNPFDSYFVSIPGGTFEMGCTPEQEQQDPVGCDSDEWFVRPVMIQSFYMGRTEITQGMWLAVMGENPSFFNQCGLNCPVENVSWNDAQEFISKLNATLPPVAQPFRLPSEAEWEYAARGNQPFAYAGSSNLDSVGWNSDNSHDSTHTVGTKKPNGFGLYDMSGNVYEYVEDYYHDSYDGAPTDGTAWIDNPTSAQRVNRSGGWKNDRNNCRTANRVKDLPDEKNNYTGFRLARSY